MRRSLADRLVVAVKRVSRTLEEVYVGRTL
jgi:hypothetical protein